MRRTALTIGTFDGVHIGHRALVERARAAAGADGEVVALVFEPHPLSVLRPESEPARLTTFAQRERWLRAAGADRVVRLAPTRSLLVQEPGTFVRGVVKKYGPMAIVEGTDFRFGRARAGSVDTLRKLSRELGFACDVVEPVEAVLDDHTVVKASSTMVRWLLSNGRVRDGAALLGRPYALEGTVVRGDRRGREIGVPTANLDTECMLPADGVYAGVARLEDGREFAAGVHVGERATFGDSRRTIEAHLIGRALGTGHRALENMGRGKRWSRIEGLPEYGWTMELELVGWVRDQAAFGSVEGLVEQMRRDCERAVEIVEAERKDSGLARVDSRQNGKGTGERKRRGRQEAAV